LPVGPGNGALMQTNKVSWQAGAESRGVETKLPPGTGAEITNCGSASFLFTTDLTKFYRKISWLLTKFYFNFIPIPLFKSKKEKVSYKTIWSRGWSQSRTTDLQLHGAGAERNIFGSATLLARIHRYLQGSGSENASALNVPPSIPGW
jgi:hypothetical protein